MRMTFTTGQAAEILMISQQTVIRNFDEGALKGFRVPGSRFRRIPLADLYAFAESNGIDHATEALRDAHEAAQVLREERGRAKRAEIQPEIAAARAKADAAEAKAKKPGPDRGP